MERIILNETIIHALSQIVNDGTEEIKRKPTHSQLEDIVNRAGLSKGYVKSINGNSIGKAKRMLHVLNYAFEFDPLNGEKFAVSLIACVKSSGGFRQDSENYMGKEAVINLQNSLTEVGISLSSDGLLQPLSLDGLSGKKLTDALKLYINRAKRGMEDAALIMGTSKDLMEAVAAHVLTECWGSYSKDDNFPTLLGKAFTALDLAAVDPKEGEHSRRKFEKALYDASCAINNFRNKQGTGHGRPIFPDITDIESKAAIELIGIVSEMMLANLEKKSAQN